MKGDPLGDERARRLQEIVSEIAGRTTRPAEMDDAVFNAMLRRMAIHQLVDEELRSRIR
jgi:hypothetical protein